MMTRTWPAWPGLLLLVLVLSSAASEPTPTQLQQLRIRLDQGQHALARSLVQDLEEEDWVRDPAFQLMAAEAEVALQTWGVAVARLERALGEWPGHAETHMRAGQVYWMVGRFNDALTVILRARELAPQTGFWSRSGPKELHRGAHR